MNKIVDFAVLIQCGRCSGSGQMHIGKIGFDCILCNAHGRKIKIVSKDEMRKFLKDDVRSAGNLTVQLEEARV